MILFTKRERERSSLFSSDTNFLGDIHGYNTSIQFTQTNYFYNNTIISIGLPMQLVPTLQNWAHDNTITTELCNNVTML